MAGIGLFTRVPRMVFIQKHLKSAYGVTGGLGIQLLKSGPSIKFTIRIRI